MVAPESLSAVPAVTAGSLPVTPSIVAGSLSATPPITTGSLSATPAVAAGSLSATTAVALAETAKALESLSAPHLPKIPTMGLSNPVVDTVRSFGELLTPLLEKVKPFCDLMTAISKVHPYAQIVWSILDGVRSAIQNQVARDSNICKLLEKMTSLYAVVNEHKEQIKSLKVPTIKSPIEFLQRVCFMQRMAKSAISKVDARINAYCDAFESLKQSFYEVRQLNTDLVVARVLDVVQRSAIKADLSDMLYSKGSAMDDEDKACLDGTRTGILNTATNWVNSDPPDPPESSESPEPHQNVLLLIGEAGTGKSAIAHSMAQRFKTLGRLGSSYGFVRNTPNRDYKHLFPTIARNMADFDEDIKEALWEKVGHDTALRTTESLKQQFENFLQKPLENLTVSGPILIVIDALDECGNSSDVRKLASIIVTHSRKLPSCVRLFITSRPEKHIVNGFEGVSHIRIERMDAIPDDFTLKDINTFIQSRLMENMQIDGIGIEQCKKLASTSQNLFQWAFVACKEIAEPPIGRTPDEQYRKLVQSGSGVAQDRLLDYLYSEVLGALFPENDTVGMDRFKSVLGVVLALFEPLTLTGIKALHTTLIRPDEVYNAGTILQYLGSLLSGVMDTDVPIRPLHTSFRDFLADLKRSKDFFVDIADAHQRIARASLCVMNAELVFNICKLESSYVFNKEIPDLQKRIEKYIPHHLSYSCRFWARHLDIASPVGINTFLDHRIRELFKKFVDENILFWLEVLSILGGVSPAFSALANAARVLKLVGTRRLSNVISD
ncbi:hypothetical protein EW026_g4501 [Hermanssonia centrifuga]|uniref:NACHT domain-containing protein n=1 Tax=Hermanssonia centrifuga TaxID=98765 RepID=A0A4S4KGX6_9APHY|nr:hypothetical protein EW026_g4501 [Hermanssonia centrifuga]